jgi:hypothetical protein
MTLGMMRFILKNDECRIFIAWPSVVMESVFTLNVVAPVETVVTANELLKYLKWIKTYKKFFGGSTPYAECHYAEWHYALCRYDECRHDDCRYVECRDAHERFYSSDHFIQQLIVC